MNDMAPWCPKCGGRWDREGSLPTEVVSGHSIGDERNTHYVLIPSGDRLEVICHLCGMKMDYPLSIKDKRKLLVEREVKLYKIIEELEKQLKETKGGVK